MNKNLEVCIELFFNIWQTSKGEQKEEKRKKTLKVDAISRLKSIEAINMRLNPIAHTPRKPTARKLSHISNSKWIIIIFMNKTLWHIRKCVFHARLSAEKKKNSRGKSEIFVSWGPKVFLPSMKNHHGAALWKTKINIASRNLALAIV